MTTGTRSVEYYEGAKKEKNQGKVVLVMTVEIGDGRTGTISVRRGDREVDLARSFVAEHGLEEGVVGPLADHIRVNLANLPSKRSKTESVTPAANRQQPAARPASAPRERPSGLLLTPRPGTTTTTTTTTTRSYSATRTRPSSAPRTRPATAPTATPTPRRAQKSDPESLKRLSVEYPRARQERLEQLRERQEMEAKKALTGRPSIDPNSARIASRLQVPTLTLYF